jgi:hypothetical protein
VGSNPLTVTNSHNAGLRVTDADYSLTPNINSKKAQDIIEKAQRMLDFAQENIEAV